MAGDGTLRITFLGTGTSHGIPMIGCQCPICTSGDPRDKRNRCGILIEFDGKVVAVDTPPEFRLACLANKVTHLDAILFTHTHADHIFGLDDTRRFTALQMHPIQCFGSERTIHSLKTIFAYAFDLKTIAISEQPRLEGVKIDGPFELFGRRFLPVDLFHGPNKIFGYRIGNFAYCTDCSRIPDETFEKLQNLDVLVLDALRFTPHPTHFTVDEAVAAAKKIKAHTTYFTHIAHEICHADLESKLPKNIHLAYDGLRIEV
jgi:phosphoribosyl 1,2-cyclic phosphate phosphodiesterase